MKSSFFKKKFVLYLPKILLTLDCLLCSCLCVEKLIKNTIIKNYCMRHCCQGTPKRTVHAEGGAVSISTKVKYEDTEITDARNHRQILLTGL